MSDHMSMLRSTFVVDLSIHSPWETLLSVARHRISDNIRNVIYIAGHHCENSELDCLSTTECKRDRVLRWKHFRE